MKNVFQSSLLKNVLMSVFLITLPLASASAFDPATAFDSKCASCHTIGGGDDVGPDLKDVSKRRDKKWLIRFIKESQSMVKEGDPIAVELFNKYRKKKMPDQEFSDDEIEQLLTFIDSGKAGAPAGKVKSALDSTPEDIELGRQYFLGEKRFANGGPSCLSCHSAGTSGFFGGGKLGPDLTHAYSNYNDKGVSKVLTKISFPSMIEVYKNASLTEDEVYQLKAFLFAEDRKNEEDKGFTKKFVFLGIIGFLLMLGLFDLIWRSRRKKTRRPLN